MCLSTKEKNCRIADTTIVCYKVVTKRGGPGFLSDIYCFPYELGKEPYKLAPLAEFPKSNPKWKECQMYISEGFHSFKRLKDAREYCNGSDKGATPDDCAGSEVILKCEIPAGAHYWTGNHNLGGRGYAEFCSDQLRVVAWKMRDDNCWRKYEKNKNWKTNKKL